MNPNYAQVWLINMHKHKVNKYTLLVTNKQQNKSVINNNKNSTKNINCRSHSKLLQQHAEATHIQRTEKSKCQWRMWHNHESKKHWPQERFLNTRLIQSNLNESLPQKGESAKKSKCTVQSYPSTIYNSILPKVPKKYPMLVVVVIV